MSCSAGTQFRRCLDQHLQLSESDYEFLADKYDQTRSGRINYRAFSGGLENGKWEGLSSVPRPWPSACGMKAIKYWEEAKEQG